MSLKEKKKEEGLKSKNIIKPAKIWISKRGCVIIVEAVHNSTSYSKKNTSFCLRLNCQLEGMIKKIKQANLREHVIFKLTAKIF